MSSQGAALRNTVCLKEENEVRPTINEKNHVPIIINAAGSNWIEVVRFCTIVDFCGVTIRSTCVFQPRILGSSGKKTSNFLPKWVFTVVFWTEVTS